MSLLNDILRDLAQHKSVADGNEGYDETLLQAASFSQKKHFPWVSLAIVFIVVFLIVITINYVLHKFVLNQNSEPAAQVSLVSAHQEKAGNVDSSIPTDQTSLGNSQVVVNITEENKNTTDATQVLSIEASNNKASNSNALNNHINDLLQQADRAIGMARLTSPIEDNAYSYYQKVLSMDGSNEDAKIGLDEIAKRYLAKAQEELSAGNLQAAEALVQRARFVSARFVQAHEINLDDRNNQFVDEAVVALDGDSHQLPGDLARQKNPPPALQRESATEIIKPFNVVEAKSLSVLPNAGWKDEQMVQHAQELIKQNKSNEALAALKKFIAVEQKPALSAALLADIYIQQGNTEAATIIAEQASYLSQDLKSKIKAQIMSTNGDNTQAIVILEKDLATAENNEPYRSLLASLYHKTANYQQSIISYQRLINNFGEKPAYWLGLALAYDGLAQYPSALQAYQRLREFPQLQEQVTQYTDQRIAALRSE